MIKPVLTYFIFLHVVGWYHCDIGGIWNDLDDVKRRRINRLVHAIVLIAGILAVAGMAAWWVAAGVCAASFLIVLMGKWYGTLPLARNKPWPVMEQVLHLAVFIAASGFVVKMGYQMVTPEWARPALNYAGIVGRQLLAWSCMLSLIGEPTNAIIREVLQNYRTQTHDPTDDLRRAGAFIGWLERVLMIILLSQGEYAAIGLVLTAKSIARFEMLKQFAEYYLMGTLLSTLAAVVASCLLF